LKKQRASNVYINLFIVAKSKSFILSCSAGLVRGCYFIQSGSAKKIIIDYLFPEIKARPKQDQSKTKARPKRDQSKTKARPKQDQSETKARPKQDQSKGQRPNRLLF